MRTVAVLLGDPRLPDATKVGGRFSPEDLESVVRMREALETLEEFRFTFLDDHTHLIDTLTSAPPTFVLNFADTGYRNDAARELHVPALLEVLGIPYSGAGPACLGLCYDKARVRAIADAAGVPVPAERYVDAATDVHALPMAFPAFVKPARADGSVGITAQSLVRDAAEARAYVEQLRASLPGRACLLQEYLPGAEYAVGLIGNPQHGFQALPLLEVDYAALPEELPPILSYESKTVPTSPYWTDIRFHPARLDAATRDSLIDHARLLFDRLDCRDYARFDFRTAADGTIKLLEVNPNPAWCWDGKFNLMAGFAGMTYREMLAAILQAALTRNDA